MNELFPALPVSGYLERIVSALRRTSRLILSASPGAGKTTLVPPALLEEFSGRVLLIEPRRIAARAAAARIAELLGEVPGGRAGYVVRGENRRSDATRLLAVTPGVLLRMIQDDPMLDGVDAVIFDEFHERALESDLAFAFVLDMARELRPELRLVVMSATLDLPGLAAVMPEAETIEVPGREYPVEIHYRESSPSWRELPREAARAVMEVSRHYSGGILVFLPGIAEIEATRQMLASELPADFSLAVLHGGLTLADQGAALRPAAAEKRKVVLATNVAESSLTVEGVSIVIDGGWEKRSCYQPAAGMSFLEPVRISLASARQRAGRAGRTGPGVALRLWGQGEEINRREHTPPEIFESELSALLLQCLRWGAPPERLPFPDPPPSPRLAAAAELLHSLGVVDESGGLTATGREIAVLPVHPRIGTMLVKARRFGWEALAAEIAAVVEENGERDFRGDADLRRRVLDLRRRPERHPRQRDLLRQLLRQFEVRYREIDVEECGIVAAFAWPEWIAQSRGRHQRFYRLAGGRSGMLTPDDDLIGADFLAVARLEGGTGRDAAIRLAAPLDRDQLYEHFGADFREERVVDFDPDCGRAAVRREKRLGALVLESAPAADDDGCIGREVLAAAIRRGIELPPPEAAAARRLLMRVRFAARNEPELYPDWEGGKFAAALPELAGGFLGNVRDFASLRSIEWLAVERLALSGCPALDRLYPDEYITPGGTRLRIDYSGDSPMISVRVQELYGVDSHPTVGAARLPLKIQLLSPAQRPIQITSDLPGFWRGSWELVRREMRSRYPKHDWPEHPESALPPKKKKNPGSQRGNRVS